MKKGKKDGMTIRLTHVRLASYTIYTAIMSVLVGVAVFLVLAGTILAMSRLGVLDTVNSLLGSEINPFTVCGLITLSGVFSVLVIMVRIIIRMLWLFVFNVVMMIVDGIGLDIGHG